MSYRSSRSSGYGYECSTERTEVLCRVIPGINTPGAVCTYPTEHNLALFTVIIVVFVKEISGVLVRWTTCNWLTNGLPKLSLITLSPPETAGYQVGRIYGGPPSISKPFHFLGIPRRVFYKFGMGNI